MVSHVEGVVCGGAETVVVSVCSGDRDKARTIRAELKKKYGNARAVNLKTRQQLYDLGMPPVDSKMKPTGPAFLAKSNIIEKLQELEDEKNELFEICPEKHRATYKYGMESHLVRVVTDNLHHSYNEVARSVETLHRIRSAGGLDGEQRVDIHEHSFSDDHLPPWGELKDALIEKYDVNCRNWGTTGVGPNEDAVDKVPVMMGTGGTPTCWGCGESGHRRGAKECKAG